MGLRRATGRAALLALGAAGCASLRERVGLGGPCRPATDGAGEILLQDVRARVTATEAELAADRDSLGLPAVPPRQVVPVRDAAVCRRAAAAYRAAAAAGALGPHSGRVHVVRAGTAYVVLDPAYYYRRRGDWTVMVFGAEWRQRSKY